MPEQNHVQNDLITMLRWQFDMGIDEALLDFPDISTPPVKFDELLAPKNVVADVPANAPAGSIVSTMPQETTKLASSRKGLITDEPAIVVPTSLSNITSLADLQAGLAGLDDCSLKHTASNLCFADGNPGARLMIIGDVPGREEDRVGLPLVGTAGQLFDRMLASISLTRADVYIAPLIPWRPPGNRTPTSEEMDMLLPWLHRHIQLADPAFVMVLGGGAAKALIPGAGSILKTRGKWAGIDFGDGKERHVMASLHPEYLLRSPAQKRLAWADLLALAGKLL